MSEELTEELVREVLERVYKDGRPFMDANILAQALRRERERADGLETVLGVMVSEKDKAINILLDSYRALRLDHEDGKNITCPHCVQEEDCNEAERIQLLTPEKALYEAKVKELESQLSQAQRTERETAIVDELVTMHEQKVKSLEVENERLSHEWQQTHDWNSKLVGYDQDHRKRIIELETKNKDLKSLVLEMQKALRHVENHCPCGARGPEHPTHPHSLGCPVELALNLTPDKARKIQEAEERVIEAARNVMEHLVPTEVSRKYPAMKYHRICAEGLDSGAECPIKMGEAGVEDLCKALSALDELRKA